jgi:hypothetical protein
MFSLFRKKENKVNEKELDKQYRMLMYRWHKLSGIDRAAADKVYEQAQSVLKQIILKKAI